MPRDSEHDYVTFESLGITLESPNATPVPIRTQTYALETTLKPEELAFSWTQEVRVGSQMIPLLSMLRSHFILWAGYQRRGTDRKDRAGVDALETNTDHRGMLVPRLCRDAVDNSELRKSMAKKRKGEGNE